MTVTDGVKLIIDDTDVNSALSSLAAAVDDLRPALLNIGEHVVASTIERFGRQVAPDGTPWAPVHPEYAKMKKGPGILRETGQLANIVYQLAGNSVEIGTNAIHARIHQFGGVIKPKTAAALVFSIGGRKIIAKQVTMPKREFLGLSDEDRAEISGIIDDYLQEAIDGG